MQGRYACEAFGRARLAASVDVAALHVTDVAKIPLAIQLSHHAKERARGEDNMRDALLAINRNLAGTTRPDFPPLVHWDCGLLTWTVYWHDCRAVLSADLKVVVTVLPKPKLTWTDFLKHRAATEKKAKAHREEARRLKGAR